MTCGHTSAITTMGKTEKQTAGNRGKQIAVKAEWHVGQRTAAWNDLWHLILNDVLQDDEKSAETDSEVSEGASFIRGGQGGERLITTTSSHSRVFKNWSNGAGKSCSGASRTNTTTVAETWEMKGGRTANLGYELGTLQSVD